MSSYCLKKLSFPTIRLCLDIQPNELVLLLKDIIVSLEHRNEALSSDGRLFNVQGMKPFHFANRLETLIIDFCRTCVSIIVPKLRNCSSWRLLP